MTSRRTARQKHGRAGGRVARDLFSGLYEQYWSSTPADAPPYLASPQIRECVVGVLARERTLKSTLSLN